MRALTLIALFMASTGPLGAHDGETHFSGLVWTFDAWIIGPLLLSGGLYVIGFVRLLRRSGGSRRMIRSAAAFWSGWLVLVAALVSPVHFMGERLFTFHMIEHELVMAAAAPLIVLARPVGIILWSLPRMFRRLVGVVMASRQMRAIWNILAGGAMATSLHALAIWGWHAPVLFDATVANVALHRFQHLVFFLTALLFWWAILWRADKGLAAWHLFVTMMHTSILGALITLAPQIVYVSQTRDAPRWGLTPFQDQQLAGLLMWVPGGVFYAGAALAMLAVWISRSSRGGRHEDPVSAS